MLLSNRIKAMSKCNAFKNTTNSEDKNSNS